MGEDTPSSPDWGGGYIFSSSSDGRGYPIQFWWGGTPIQSRWWLVPHPVLMGEWVPPMSPDGGTPISWMGYPYWPDWGTPPLVGWGNPISQIGYTQFARWGTPCWLDEGTPLAGWGTPSTGWVLAPTHLLDGVPPTRNVNRQTPVKTIPSLVLRARTVTR